MKYTITLILILITLVGYYGQSPISIGIYISPESSYRVYSDEDTRWEEVIKERNDRESPDWIYNYGVYIAYSPTEKFGFTVDLKKQQFGFIDKGSYTSIDAAGQPIEIDYKYHLRFHFLQSSLRFNFHFLNKNKFSIYTTGGGTVSIFQAPYIVEKENGWYSKQKLEISDKSAINTILHSVQLGVGLHYYYDDHIGLFTQSTFTYNLNKFVKQDIGMRFYSMGIQTGVTYNF